MKILFPQKMILKKRESLGRHDLMREKKNIIIKKLKEEEKEENFYRNLLQNFHLNGIKSREIDLLMEKEKECFFQFIKEKGVNIKI